MTLIFLFETKKNKNFLIRFLITKKNKKQDELSILRENKKKKQPMILI
jgi:hypothetical protein